MRKNIGKYERIIRILFGVLLFIYGFYSENSIFLSWFFIFFGLLSITTGFVGWCGIYSIFSVSSKGRGIDRITKRDIEKAIKENSIKLDIKEKNEKPKIKKKVVSSSSKKLSKKTSKKKSSSKLPKTKKISSNKNNKK